VINPCGGSYRPQLTLAQQTDIDSPPSGQPSVVLLFIFRAIVAARTVSGSGAAWKTRSVSIKKWKAAPDPVTTYHVLCMGVIMVT